MVVVLEKRGATADPTQHPLFLHATSSALMRPRLRLASPHVKKKIAEILVEGRPLSEDVLTDECFAKAVALLARKEMVERAASHEPDIESLIANGHGYDAMEAEMILGAKRARTALDLCARSSVPSQYALLMARFLLDTEKFGDSVSLFGGDRKIKFENIPREMRRIAREFEKLLVDGIAKNFERLVELVAGAIKEAKPSKSLSEIRKYSEKTVQEIWEEIRISKELIVGKFIYLEEEIARIAGLPEPPFDERFRNRERIETARTHLPSIGLYPFVIFEDKIFGFHAIQSVFRFGDVRVFTDRYKLGLGIMGDQGYANELDAFVETTGHKRQINGANLQHELQHVFDTLIGINECDHREEYRAYSGSLVFSTADQTMKEYENIWADAQDSGKSMEGHDRAKRRIASALGNPSKWKICPQALSKEARMIFNAAYVKAVGLTYDQIVEPFRVNLV